MLVALPSAIAFGITIFAPLGGDFGAKGALAGMLGVTALGLIAATFGGTQRLISAPCAPAAAVLSALTIQLSQTGVPSASIVLSLFLVALVSSGAQIVFGALKIGQLIKYMPFPVVSGYLSGVGLIIIFSQIPKWLALPKGMNWFQGLQHPEAWQLPSLVIGAATAAVMIMAPKISLRIPPVIQGLLAGILIYWVLAFSTTPELLSLTNNHYVIGPLSADLGGLRHAMTSPWISLQEIAMPH
jgi:SulP family sulfate permease